MLEAEQHKDMDDATAFWLGTDGSASKYESYTVYIRPKDGFAHAKALETIAQIEQKLSDADYTIKMPENSDPTSDNVTWDDTDFSITVDAKHIPADKKEHDEFNFGIALDKILDEVNKEKKHDTSLADFSKSQPELRRQITNVIKQRTNMEDPGTLVGEIMGLISNVLGRGNSGHNLSK